MLIFLLIMPLSNKSLRNYFLVLFLLSVSPGIAIAKEKEQSHSTYAKSDWSLYPFTIQLSSHGGFSLPMLLVDTYGGKNNKKEIFTLGGRLDISLTYVNPWIWENFDCYPKLGLLGKYDWVLFNKIDKLGYIRGGLFYIEPNYFHLRGFEIVPRMGVGVSQVYVPGHYYNSTEAEEERVYAVEPTDVEPLRDDVSLDVIVDLLFKYRITPNWYINFGLGANVLPDLSDAADSTFAVANPNVDERTLVFYNSNLSVGYTINPSSFNPERSLVRKVRTDISWVSAFRRLPPKSASWLSAGSQGALSLPPVGKLEGKEGGADANKNQKTKTPPDPDAYYYVGGINAQWAIQMTRHHAFVVGTEWVADWSTRAQQKGLLLKNMIKGSIILGHEFLWGRLMLDQLLGVYGLNMTPNPDGPDGFALNNLIYGQVGLRIKITKWLHVGASLRNALHFPRIPGVKYPKDQQPPLLKIVPEFIDFKIGYSF